MTRLNLHYFMAVPGQKNYMETLMLIFPLASLSRTSFGRFRFFSLLLRLQYGQLHRKQNLQNINRIWQTKHISKTDSDTESRISVLKLIVTTNQKGRWFLRTFVQPKNYLVQNRFKLSVSSFSEIKTVFPKLLQTKPRQHYLMHVKNRKYIKQET